MPEKWIKICKGLRKTIPGIYLNASELYMQNGLFVDSALDTSYQESHSDQ